MPEQSNSTPYWNTGGPKTYSEADLSEAIEAGILPVETAIRLKQQIIEKQSSFSKNTKNTQKAPSANEEFFRLVGGFNDIFVVIACTLLLVATFTLFSVSNYDELAGLFMAIMAWGLAEYFVRIKGLALTAILLFFAFIGGVAIITFPNYGGSYALPHNRETFFIISACLSAIASWLHWKRFKVPITVAGGAGAAIVLTISSLVYTYPTLEEYLNLLLFIAGMVVIALAMRWDSSDTERQTRKSDIAFWLHLLAAPLLVHPVFMTLNIFTEDANILSAIIIVLLYGAVAFVSLCIDRRALMVSSLGYVLYAFNVLLTAKPDMAATSGFPPADTSTSFAISGLIVSASLLLLAAFWQPARVRALNILPKNIQRKLPPAHAA